MLNSKIESAESGLAVFDVQSPSGIEISQIRHSIEQEGAIIVRNLITPECAGKTKEALIHVLDIDVKNYGMDYRFRGMVHALMNRGQVFLDLLAVSSLVSICKSILGHGCIINGFNSSSMPPSGSNFSRSIHVDCPRLIPNYITNLGITLALDPFTKNNGGMEIAAGSFLTPDQPSEESFADSAIQPKLGIGDAIVFNARCWHRGGINRTDSWRHAVTFNVCRAYMRQQFDYTRMLGAEQMEALPEEVRQFLGYYVRMPENMDEFLLPPELRKYRPGQE